MTDYYNCYKQKEKFLIVCYKKPNYKSTTNKRGHGHRFTKFNETFFGSTRSKNIGLVSKGYC